MSDASAPPPSVEVSKARPELGRLNALARESNAVLDSLGGRGAFLSIIL